MTEAQKTRVAVNGYGVIGKRVAAAVKLQEDMSLAGVSDVVTDWRAHMVTRSGFSLLGATTESHESGIMNTLVPEPEIPSHQGPDARSVDPEPRRRHDGSQGPGDVGAPALLVHPDDPRRQQGRGPQRIPHVITNRTDEHRRRAGCAQHGDGTYGRSRCRHDNLYEVALWAGMPRVQGDELFYAYMVDNQAIVIPETIETTCALAGTVRAASESIVRTNTALGIDSALM